MVKDGFSRKPTAKTKICGRNKKCVREKCQSLLLTFAMVNALYSRYLDFYLYS